MINQKQSTSSSTNKFRQGMTLDQYLSTMKTLPKSDNSDDKNEEDLYETSRRLPDNKYSNKIMTYEIRESDEDNYDQSLEVGKAPYFHYQKLQPKLYKQDFKIAYHNAVSVDRNQGGFTKNRNTPEFRVRRQSNSPYKPAWKEAVNFSPNKIFSQTLHSKNDWRIHKDPPPKTQNTSSTIYGKFIKGFKNPDREPMKPNQKQKYFRKKNHQEIEHLTKYEKEIHEKYEKFRINDLINMRIQGVQDRLCDRKIFNNRKLG